MSDTRTYEEQQRIWWATPDEYGLAHRCSYCHAEPGAECTGKPRLGRFHRVRQFAGQDHYGRDVVSAPWSEDRDPSANYSTIPR